MSVAMLHVHTKLQAGLQFCTHSLQSKWEDTFSGPNSGRNILKLIFLLLSPWKKKKKIFNAVPKYLKFGTFSKQMLANYTVG
jgi:hypothetical protein